MSLYVSATCSMPECAGGKSLRRSIFFVLLACGLGFAVPASAGPLIINGSFETASVDPGPSCLELFAGDTSIEGWEVTGLSIHYCNPGYWPASDGMRSLDLDGETYSYGGVRQIFGTVAGLSYTVAFDMGGNNYNEPFIKPMRVSADGQSEVFEFDTRIGGYGWSALTWTFVADDDSATLEFFSLTAGTEISGWGPLIDNVSVVPEPETRTLLLASLFGLAALRQSIGASS